MRRFALVVFCLSLLAVPLAATAAIADCFDATCKVVHPGRPPVVGTGCVLDTGTAADRLYVLSAGHVLGRPGDRLELSFYRDGREIGPVPARTVYARNDWRLREDLGVAEVACADLGTFRPAAIPLADCLARSGESFVTVGCPRGGWPSAFEGEVVSAEPTSLYIAPRAVKGRSGSGLFDAAGERLMGVVVRYTKDQQYGVAVPATRVRAMLERDVPAGLFGCRGGQCQPQTQAVPYVLPVTTGAAPAQDLTPVTEKLDQLLASQSGLIDALEKMVGAEKADQLRPILAEAPERVAPITERAMARDWGGVVDQAVDKDFVGWVGPSLATALIAFTGAGGLLALLIRFGVPMGLGVVANMVRSRRSTAADDLLDQVADKVAAKTGANGNAGAGAAGSAT